MRVHDLITADSGGSNGSQVHQMTRRLSKTQQPLFLDKSDNFR